MGAPLNSKSTSFTLPPGTRFHPSEEQIMCFYLTNKNGTNGCCTDNHNRDRFNGYDLIREINLYDYDPSDLPESACFAYGRGGRKRHWFCFTVRVLRNCSVRVIRRSNVGYWKMRGKVRDVVGEEGSSVLGTRTRFVFYLGNSMKNAVRTGWIMYEYALIDHPKAPFVLCHIFVKPRAGNSLPENRLSSCSEESVSVALCNDVQKDVFLEPDVAEDKLCAGVSVGQENGTSRCPVRPVDEKKEHTTAEPTPVTSFNFPANIMWNQLVRTSGLANAGCDEEFLSILEEDFIELDDLVD